MNLCPSVRPFVCTSVCLSVCPKICAFLRPPPPLFLSHFLLSEMFILNVIRKRAGLKLGTYRRDQTIIARQITKTLKKVVLNSSSY